MIKNKRQVHTQCMETGYTKLANAIILQAVKDYRAALRKLSKHPYDNSALSLKRENEQFFRSSGFKDLTDIDPEMLICKLNEGV